MSSLKVFSLFLLVSAIGLPESNAGTCARSSWDIPALRKFCVCNFGFITCTSYLQAPTQKPLWRVNPRVSRSAPEFYTAEDLPESYKPPLAFEPEKFELSGAVHKPIGQWIHFVPKDSESLYSPYQRPQTSE